MKKANPTENESIDPKYAPKWSEPIPEPVIEGSKFIKVRAIAAGHDGKYYRNPGDVFTIDTHAPVLNDQGEPTGRYQNFFSEIWMEKIPNNVPETPITKSRVRHPLDILIEQPQHEPRTLSEVNI